MGATEEEMTGLLRTRGILPAASVRSRLLELEDLKGVLDCAAIVGFSKGYLTQDILESMLEVWNGRKSNECIRFDGNRKLHAIDLTFENGAVQVYPNPANQMLSVASADFEPSQFQMTDAAGRIVMEGRWATEIQLVLDVAALPNGIFTFSAWDAQGHYEVMPVMISH